MERREGYTNRHFSSYGGTKGRRGGFRGGWEDGSMVYCYYYKEQGHIKYQCSFWKVSQRETHISLPLFQMTSSCDVSLSSSDMSAVAEHVDSIFLFLSHSNSNRYSYILSYIIYIAYLDYKFKGKHNCTSTFSFQFFFLFSLSSSFCSFICSLDSCFYS